MAGSDQFLPVLQQAQAHPQHDWLLTTAQVAQGFEVTDAAIRNHKNRKPDELLEGKHWLKDSEDRLWWTKRGVVRLGFFVDSPLAKAFRDAAEDYVVCAPVSPGETNCVALDDDLLAPLVTDLADQAIWDAVAGRLTGAIAQRIQQIRYAPTVADIRKREEIVAQVMRPLLAGAILAQSLNFAVEASVQHLQETGYEPRP